MLGGSRDPLARSALLAAALASPWPRRAQMLTCLWRPLDEGEVAALLAAVEEGRRHLSASVGAHDPHWSCVQRLVATLPPPQRLGVLAQDWLDQPGYAALLLAGPVMRALGAGGAEEVGQLLERAATNLVPEPVVQALLAQLHTLPEPHAVDMAESAHQLLGSERTAAARQHYRERVQMYRGSVLSGRDHYRAAALSALAAMALTEPPAPAEADEITALDQGEALLDYADALRPGETSELEVATMNAGQLRRLGAALGLRLRGDLPHQREEARHQRETPDPVQAATADTVTILETLKDHGDKETLGSPGDAACAQVLAGLIALAPGLVTDDLVRSALDAGPASTAVIARAAPSPTAATLGEDPGRWPPTRVLDVLKAITPTAATRSLEQLVGALNWDALDSAGDLQRVAAALARHPRLLATAVRTAVTSQDGPTAQTAPLARVVTLVNALVSYESHVRTQAGAVSEWLHDEAALIEVLVDSLHDELHEVAGHWLACSVPTEELTELVVRADDDTFAKPNPYSLARTTMAERLCARARDDGPQREARIEALRGAQRLDEAQARATALDLIETSTRQLALAAAGVIATTQPAPGEGDRLTTLIERQSNKNVREHLERARQRLTSGSLGEALTNAVDLVGARDSFGDLDPDICLPDVRVHAAFIRCVDQARISATESPNSRLNAMINLADLLGEQAIAAYWLQTGTVKEKEKAEKLRAGAEDKEDIGFLAIQQNLAQRLRWLSHLATLRDLRTAHPTPRGSTTPLELSEADAVSAVPLLRRIFEGWVQRMHIASDQPLPPASR